MTYTERLKSEGFTNERAETVSDALNTLHAALSKLDRQHLKQFFSLPTETRLSNYAQAEGLMDLSSLK